MLNEQTATVRLSREMRVAEQSIAAALVDVTALLHTCAVAARDNAAQPLQVQATFLRAQKTADMLIRARGEAARTHGALLDIYREKAGTEEPGGCPDYIVTGAELSEETRSA